LEGDVLTYLVSYEGLTGNIAQAHLHGPAAAGANAGVFFHLLPSPSFPANTRAGVLLGQQTLTAAQKTAVEAGQTYVNVHTSAVGSGEIRGQVLP
ncbi:MAG: CHRD domain-containing protein, partial [Verrucomicrobiota bacterium]